MAEMGKSRIHFSAKNDSEIRCALIVCELKSVTIYKLYMEREKGGFSRKTHNAV